MFADYCETGGAESLARDFASLEDSHLTKPGFQRGVANLLERSGMEYARTGVLTQYVDVVANESLLGWVDENRKRFAGIALATNQTEERLEAMLGVLYDGLFDAVCASCRVGARKPEPEFYAALRRLTGTPACAIILIDDRRENVVAARAEGFRAEVLPRLGTGFDLEQAIARAEAR